MFKFLRKYSVWILGIGGTLLLIAFLAPNVIQQLAQRAGYSGAVQATVGDGEEISNDIWQLNLSESQIIDRIGASVPGLGNIQSPEHWYLLTREADFAGLTPPIDAVTQLGWDPQTILNISGGTGQNTQIVLRALAHFEGIRQLVKHYQSAGRFSDRRLHKAADDFFSSVAVETVVIPALPEDNGSFSENAMQAQLDAWADVPNGEGDYGFGYQLPDRFKTEWLVIPSASITETARESDAFSSKEQRKFWRRNENDPRFSTINTENSNAIPQKVSDAYLEQLTNLKRVEIARSASEHLRAPRRGIEEANGFLILPDHWADQQLSLENLAATLQSEFGLSLPEYGSIAEWTSIANANTTPIIGEILAVNQGDSPVDFTTLVSSAKEFDKTGLYRIQESIASPVLETSNGDLIVFRLTETDPARAPINLEEVQEQVNYDLGRIARWETLQAESNLIEQHAREKGLLALSIEHNAVVNPPQPVSMIETSVPSILGPESRRPLMMQSIVARIVAGDQVSEMVSTIPSLEQPDRQLIQSIVDRASDLPLDVPVANLPVNERVFVLPSPTNMALVLVRVTGTTPASSELVTDFTSNSNAILQTLLSYDELGGAEQIGDAFSFDALAQRHNFVRPQRSQDNDSQDVVQVDDAEVN